MALQHKIKWEIASSCRKKKSENHLEFPFKSRTDAAARRRCRRVRSKNNKSHSKVKASFDGSKELKNSIFFLLQYAASLVMVRLQQSFLKQTLLFLCCSKFF